MSSIAVNCFLYTLLSVQQKKQDLSLHSALHSLSLQQLRISCCATPGDNATMPVRRRKQRDNTEQADNDHQQPKLEGTMVFDTFCTDTNSPKHAVWTHHCTSDTTIALTAVSAAKQWQGQLQMMIPITTSNAQLFTQTQETLCTLQLLS